MPSKILVSDTNIWIDLHHSNLLEKVFQLPHQFVTTDFVWRELRKPPGAQLKDLGLTIEGISGDETLELFGLKQTLNNSSLADVSCYFMARERGWTLLTNDGALRKSGRRASLDVRGVLWILDELEHHQVLPPAELFNALTAMLNAGARLPEDECNKRLARWRAG
ncbi:type II toxin-antitoxin system VapC family toxin [Marinobacter salarius]|jgi:predicted nucleic acid-binding protein|uniref:type II toxin-antitoxin system VapC family toxin n=1 Tax=Marinobacter salarius TaxID=1420917 RepID=UPI0022AF0A40|nr:type II toxin-antitoxin system VapC family toxin [Marinobacter salarius]MCZ4283562.1 type II toxin-antitoxin system VapC family toxin [Marinobacter salarius]